MTGNLANVIGLENDQPLFLAIAPKEYGWYFACRTIGLRLCHPLLWLNLLATLALNVEWEIIANHIPTTALWIPSVLLRASGFLPALFP